MMKVVSCAIMIGQMLEPLWRGGHCVLIFQNILIFQ